ncbi:hypothetical protein QU481_05260 [Crenobacter sp. SG2303]|uniref:Uncharacterized protein n=1 Tax=Crenobacter oryzisoli TaxID=3056844 RepID=A0ABT7XKI1_9NEIS|nr:hypothetical protein [Crenobacter sp. SG2303]MDN0074299.1 hypothetical protein [Crenobacter sp. SG2303]
MIQPTAVARQSLAFDDSLTSLSGLLPDQELWLLVMAGWCLLRCPWLVLNNAFAPLRLLARLVIGRRSLVAVLYRLCFRPPSPASHILARHVETLFALPLGLRPRLPLRL